jgi:hypothetical protein
VLAHRFFAKDRSVMFDLAAKLQLKATSADENDSDIQPRTVHADTQGQSFPVFALATLFGQESPLPRRGVLPGRPRPCRR